MDNSVQNYNNKTHIHFLYRRCAYLEADLAADLQEDHQTLLYLGSLLDNWINLEYNDITVYIHFTQDYRTLIVYVK